MACVVLLQYVAVAHCATVCVFSSVQALQLAYTGTICMRQRCLVDLSNKVSNIGAGPSLLDHVYPLFATYAMDARRLKCVEHIAGTLQMPICNSEWSK